MITVRLKQKFDTEAEAILALMTYINQGDEYDFELTGRETKGATFDAQLQYEKALKDLGLETT